MTRQMPSYIIIYVYSIYFFLITLVNESLPFVIGAILEPKFKLKRIENLEGRIENLEGRNLNLKSIQLG